MTNISWQSGSALDRATESGGLWFRNGLACEYRFNRITQVIRRHQFRFFLIIYAPVIDELIAGVEEEDFGRALRAEPVGDLVALILEDRERQVVCRRMSFDVVRRFPGV